MKIEPTSEGFHRLLNNWQLKWLAQDVLFPIRLHPLDIVEPALRLAPIGSDLTRGEEGVEDVDEGFPIDAELGDQVFLADAVPRGDRGKDVLGR